MADSKTNLVRLLFPIVHYVKTNTLKGERGGVRFLFRISYPQHTPPLERCRPRHIKYCGDHCLDYNIENTSLPYTLNFA